jgi:hypothetical protein
MEASKSVERTGAFRAGLASEEWRITLLLGATFAVAAYDSSLLGLAPSLDRSAMRARQRSRSLPRRCKKCTAMRRCESVLVGVTGDHATAAYLLPALLLAILVVLAIPETAAQELETISPDLHP